MKRRDKRKNRPKGSVERVQGQSIALTQSGNNNTSTIHYNTRPDPGESSSHGQCSLGQTIDELRLLHQITGAQSQLIQLYQQRKAT